MSDKTKNDEAWEKLFDKYNILQCIDNVGTFKISADQIREFREPRLMTKFDHHMNLPQVFKDKKLAILPVTRGDYIIGRFNVYHDFEEDTSSITKVQIPDYIESLSKEGITSEAIALNTALASKIVADFLGEDDDKLVSTVSGRMGSGEFSFRIDDNKTGAPSNYIKVSKAQIEIDAAYEGLESLSIFEAKMDLSADFLVRQLYYPFRVWEQRIRKRVRPVFLIYSNGIYTLKEYSFENIENYNSLKLVKQKRYSLEDTSLPITIDDIYNILNFVSYCEEPDRIPFPQADKFEKVINICELIQNRQEYLTKEKITEEFEFDKRQSDYYTNAARYLGLVEKSIKKNKDGKNKDGSIRYYTITEKGKHILSMNYRQRQLSFVQCILEHKVFADALRSFLETGKAPTKTEIKQIIENNHIKKISGDTLNRRASSVSGWINWIVSLNNEA